MGAPRRGVSHAASAAVAVAALGAFVLAGCGGKDQGPNARKPAQEAGAVVNTFERDLLAGDHQHICNEIFSSQVREQAGGRGCAGFLRRTAGPVKRSRIEVKAVALMGDTAKVRVETSASGQARVAETIELVRQGGRFRIASLSR
ncbi:MAG TPA: hypothetical protein VF752_03015 [Thermoleophilaceae bacterium]